MCQINCGTLGVAALCLAALNAQPAKTVKDQEEFALYNDVIKDINANNFAKALTGLDAWKRKYPDSDYRDDREAFYVQAYAATSQPAQSVDAAAGLISKDLNAIFPGPAGQATVIRLLYNTTWAISGVPNPTSAQLATGERAARQLMAYDQQLPGVTAAQWAEARADMRDKAKAALLHIAMLPGIQAMAEQPPDCAAAESAYAKALGDYPDKSAVSYELARALACEAKGTPEKLPLAIYEFERAAVVDATLGDPQNDPKKIRAFADNSYVKLHGSDEGLDQLKQQAKAIATAASGLYHQIRRRDPARQGRGV